MTIVTHFTVLDQSDNDVLGVRLQGRLEDDVFRALASELETRASSGGLRLLLELKTIKNYSPGELWEAMSRPSPSLAQVERLALVCDDEQYRDWLATLASSPVSGEIQCFLPEELRAAWDWVKN